MKSFLFPISLQRRSAPAGATANRSLAKDWGIGSARSLGRMAMGCMVLKCVVLGGIVLSSMAASSSAAEQTSPAQSSSTESSSAEASARDQSSSREASSADSPTPTQIDEIDRLILQLGDNRYIVRREAAERLRRIGLRAFDRLHEAKYHDQIEIGMAARRLVNGLMVQWSLPGDSKEVREALDGYGGLSENARVSRIELLAGLPDRAGAIALARLARYETSSRLSAAAAMALLQQTPHNDPERRVDLANELRGIVQDPVRLAARWIELYANDLVDQTFAVDRWSRFIDDRRNQVDASATDQADRDTVLRLVQILAAHGQRMGHDDDAVTMVLSHLDLVSPQPGTLIDVATWAIDHDLYRVVEELRDRFETFFDKDPLLAYAAAEAALRMGDEKESLKRSANAALMPVIPAKDEIEKWQPRQLQLILQRHCQTAMRLQDRGLYSWALREYRSVIDAVPLDNPTGLDCRYYAAELLSELKQHADVIELLQPVAERSDKDREFRQTVTMEQQLDRLENLMDYHRAEQMIERGSIAEGCALLQDVYDRDQENVDILIRMYQIEHDDDWRQSVRQQVREKVSQYDQFINQAFGRAQLRMLNINFEPADAYNNYAWLVSNTEGDFEKALNYAQRAVAQTDSDDVDSAAARMDTCARCHFALGQIDQAIAMQRRAIKRMPHSPPLMQQLELFQDARDKEEASP